MPRSVAPLAEEIVVTKHRVSAFAGTDLDLMLRANGIETLILTGIVTSGVVLSTLRHAADADYRLLVVGDCCSDRDEETHRVLLEKVFPRQATITTAAGLTQAIGAGGRRRHCSVSIAPPRARAFLDGKIASLLVPRALRSAPSAESSDHAMVME
jgi:isochorismate hydrolase